MDSLLFLIAPMIVAVIIIPKSLLLIKENQRVVVLRIGKFHQTLSPGVHLIMPIIDIPTVVNLSKHFPDWQSLSDQVINEKVKKLVLFDPDPKKYR